MLKENYTIRNLGIGLLYLSGFVLLAWSFVVLSSQYVLAQDSYTQFLIDSFDRGPFRCDCTCPKDFHGSSISNSPIDGTGKWCGCAPDQDVARSASGFSDRLLEINTDPSPPPTPRSEPTIQEEIRMIQRISQPTRRTKSRPSTQNKFMSAPVESVYAENVREGTAGVIICYPLGTGTQTSDTPDTPNDPGAPVLVELTANPSAIDSGGSSTLSWTTVNANACSINQGIGSVDPNDPDGVNVSPDSDTTFTLTCSNDSGQDSDSATVFIADAEIDIDTDIEGEKPNGCIDINWSVNNAGTEVCTPSSAPASSNWNSAVFSTPGGSGSGTVEVCDHQLGTTLTLTCGSASGSFTFPFIDETNPGASSYNIFDFLRGIFPGFVNKAFAA